jgi:hypothetical protein
MKGDSKARLWGLVSRGIMIQVFKWPHREKLGSSPVMLPAAVRKYFGSWRCTGLHGLGIPRQVSTIASKGLGGSVNRGHLQLLARQLLRKKGTK